VDFEKVESSQIHSMAHSPDDGTMTVRFRCAGCAGQGKPEGSDFGCERCGGTGVGLRYRYTGVSKEKYVAVRDDPESVGKAFHRLIKSDPKAHPHERL
jgi:hypothetical protein